MGQIFYTNVASWQYYAYNGLCLVTLVGLLWKYRGDLITILVIMLFFGGVIDDLMGATGRNVYRMGLLGVCVWQSTKGAFNYFYQEYPKVFYTLCLYILYYITTSIIVNHDNFLLVFSLLSKLLIPLLILMLMLKADSEDEQSANTWFWIFEDLILMQIGLSIAKMVILGGFLEGWVGSMSGIRGGGSGTSFPLLGLMWLALKTDMDFSRKDWLLAFGLLILGFAAGKRAVWIMFPILFCILSMYVYSKSLAKIIVVVLAIAPILFYLTVRVSPTFNPDNKVWGTFDPEYAINYGLKYTAGIDESHAGVQTGVGRLGALTWMLEQFSQDGKNVVFGRGNEYMTYANKDDYFNAAYYGGIQGRGSITGIVSTFFTLGVAGIAFYFLFFSCTFLSNRSRFNYVLFGVILVDYLFYNAQTLNLMPLTMLALFLSFFSTELQEEY